MSNPTTDDRITYVTRIAADWKCPRYRYYRNEWNRVGLTTTDHPLELFIGTALHDGLAVGARHAHAREAIPVDDIALAGRKQVYTSLMELEDSGENQEFANEQGSLVEGLLRGFFRHTWPLIMAETPHIVAVEDEVFYTIKPGLKFSAKPDLLTADDNGDIRYIEYKSTSSKKPEWINSWQTAVQLHASTKAVKETSNHDVSSVVVVGLYKGWESYGKQSSPFCYAYRRAGNPPFTSDEFTYDYRAGFRKHPVWQLEGGVKKWVADMPDNIVADQFPTTFPIFPNEDLITQFFEQVNNRESEIVEALAKLDSLGEDGDARRGVLNLHFPQRFSECQPSFGRPCPFRLLCHGSPDINPLDAGFIERPPHIDLEVKQS